ncbi:MAG TPA: adenylate/guanylate cyclase domain-containing protein [Candidatus Limnocylindrales bacterium]|nr:adenylate/guanylate cyclase domain-containing protein [Candidatus Limnocylindrales bacterium]
MIDTLEQGRDAVRRHAWDEGVDALSAVDRDGALSPDDLELLGTAEWWAGRPDDASDALERAFAAYDEAGRTEDAARVAITLAYNAYRRLAGAIGAGWQARAEHLLDSIPDSRLHAQKMVFDGFGQLMEGHLEAGIETLDRAMDLAQRTGNIDARFVAMSLTGMAEVMLGRWRSGIALVDEAATAASSGRLDIRAASDIFCTTMAACRSLGDLERAGQWADEGERWMRRNGAGGYPGICQVHRAELKMLRGQWSEAEQEARRACDVLQRFRLLDGLGYAHNAVGEIRLRMGDLDAAAEAFDRAYEYGHDAQPGLSMLQLARGQLGDAQRSIARALTAVAGATGRLDDRAARGRLLPAQVDIALAAGDLDTAQRAVTELEQIAIDFERPLYRAGALTARGEVLLGENRAEEASPVLGESWRLWQATDVPYEAAQARLRYAQALAAEGDDSAARRDLLAARAMFERLGAVLDLERVDALLRGEAGPASARGGERASRTFMFTDIVTSTDLVSVIGDEAWRELLEWHDRELRAAVTQHRGEIVSHTGDGFFASFDGAADAVEAAVDVQRRLVRHRHEHGFSPAVRIGLHAADATRRGRDYSGRGVHIAARVGAAAGREEILATASVLAQVKAARFRLSEPRELTLKGVREPIEARSIDWRP